jgi:uncharacterized membrane protein YhaH (DUF805 family)
MSAANPYAPPQADVDDVHDRTAAVEPVKFFTWKGRINRLRYLAYFAVSYVLFIAIAAFGGGVGAAMGSGAAATAIGGIAFVIYGVYAAFLTIQRSHDMGWTGWTALLTLIPFVGFVWLFKAGTPGANEFGGPPPANTLGVKILAWIFPAIFIIGILAAIALPAYQDYTKRAKAAQMR